MAAPSGRPRRAVYVSRVDAGDGEDHIIQGSEHSVGTAPRRPQGGSRGAATGQKTQPVSSGDTESPDERWLKENVPPHW